MHNFGGFFGPSFNGSGFFLEEAPVPSANLILMLEGDTVTLNGSTVSAWPDLSGNGINFVQANSLYQPSYITGALNGHNVVRFNGIADYMTNATVSTGNFSIFVVTANQRTVLLNAEDTLITNQQTSGSYNGLVMSSFDYYNNTTQKQLYSQMNSATIVNYVNGATTPLTLTTGEWALLEATFSSGTNSTIGWTIGANSPLTLFGQVDIAAIYIYDAVLSATQRTQVETAARERFALY